MKRLKLLCVVPLAVVIATPLRVSAQVDTVETIVVPISAEGVRVEDDGGGIARFLGAPATGSPGQPALPKISRRVLLPPDADLSSTTARLVEEKEEGVAGEWDVRPAPPYGAPGHNIDWPAGVDPRSGRDTVVYARNGWVPSSFLIGVTVKRKGPWKMAGVALSLYRFNPVEKRLVGLRSGKLVITFKRTGVVAVPRIVGKEARETREDMRRQVANFDAMVGAYDTDGRAQ